MLRAFRWLALVGVVATAALVGPSLALAGNCGDTSATSIYSGQCTPTATGKHDKKPVTQKPSTTTTPTPWVQPVTPAPPAYHPPAHLSGHAKHAVHVIAGAANRLTKLLSMPNHGHVNRVDPVLASSPTKESGLGPAFDLGSGPILLFALLAGTVLVLLGTGGVRSWRNRHRV